MASSPGGSRCRQFGHELDETSGRCSWCDSVLSPPVSKAGERRHITVVFCDLVGSTVLAEQLDPEELRDLIRAYQQLCAAVVERYDGHIAQYLGDGVLIYFGFPNAHEDDPALAIRAGLEIVRLVSSTEFPRTDPSGTRLLVRLGIHSGLVVAGQMGSQERPEVLALGSAPNVAARLQALAPSNSVVVSAETRRLTDGYFEFEELDERARIGSQSIAAFRVLRASILQTPFELAVVRGLTPFQNRELPLEALGRCWRRVTLGEGAIAFITGEPGIGKSRLVHQLQNALSEDGAIWLSGRGSSFKQDDAFWPLAEALRGWLGGPSDLADERWSALLQARLDELEFQGSDRFLLLATLLGLPVSPSKVSALELTPQQMRSRTLETTIELLLRVARRRPVALYFEDLHWVDPSTLEFLHQIAPRLRSVRIFVVLTARPSLAHVWPEGVELCSLNLSPLAPPQIATIVQHICRDDALPEEMVAHIVQRTDGVPLFVEELTKTLLESGAHASHALSSAPAPGAIPETLQDSLMSRLDRLPLGKPVAQLAAVLGREFDLELLGLLGICEGTTLRHGLQQLLAADLVRPVESVPPGYVFKHALVQDVAYSSLLRSDRRQYHQRVAETLLREFPERTERQPELLAHHLTEAALPGRALGYWLRAARRSMDRGANAEALRHLERARAGVSTLPPDASRWETELQIEMLLAQVARATAGYASREMEDAYIRALELCQRLGDASTGAVGTQMLVARVRCGEDFLTRSLAQNPRVGNRLFWIMWGFGAYHQSRAELSKALDIGNQLVDVAGGEPALALEGHFGAGSTCYFMGRLREARGHLERGWECFETLHRVAETSPTGHHAEVLCAGYLSLCLWELGFTAEAERQSELAIQSARTAGHSYSVAYALTIASWLGQMSGDHERAAARVAEGRAVAQQFGFSFALAWLQPISLWLESQGHTNSGDLVERFRKHLRDYLASGYRVAITYFYGLLADVLLAAGRVSEASTVLDEALLEADKGGERFWQPELYRLRAEVLGRAEPADLPAARQSAEAALELAKRLGARPLELRAGMSLAKHAQI